AAGCSDTLSEGLATGTAPAAGPWRTRRVDADDLVDMCDPPGSQEGARSHPRLVRSHVHVVAGSSTSLSARGWTGPRGPALPCRAHAAPIAPQGLEAPPSARARRHRCRARSTHVLRRRTFGRVGRRERAARPEAG